MKTASAFAPGRVELLGNHTDYNEGVVLGAAIDLGLTVAGSKRDDSRIAIHSDRLGTLEVEEKNWQPLGEPRWANYIIGVARELGISGGFACEVTGNLPLGCGLSSSAALEVATALFLLQLHEGELPRLEIARACQRAEHRFAGVRSGLLDQVTSLFGEADHAVFFDARTEEARSISFPPGFALLIAESGRPRELAGGAYNLRRDETAAAAAALGVRALRDVNSKLLAARSDVPDLLRRRARHIVEENERVWQALDLLGAGDAAGFGKLMNASHESSRANFENSTPELDQLVAAAQRMPGVLGARLTGGGFGGATVTLCEEHAAETIAQALASQFRDPRGEPIAVLISRFAAGARRLS